MKSFKRPKVRLFLTGILSLNICVFACQIQYNNAPLFVPMLCELLVLLVIVTSILMDDDANKKQFVKEVRDRLPNQDISDWVIFQEANKVLEDEEKIIQNEVITRLTNNNVEEV